ncbi:hypothetical protein ITP53_52850 [Nonomuraea sp. K274]|uniref:Uncharacterized protein n=1 Tax=Nonomuraea cypriaca TaxID=1187855 RepID=A0A931AJJ8_9ACTN|nr:DUF6203 family protein [Nonomuraea cypriaca]MBF8194217.1 hypothetical protein [Nonomuraea cypriaca]
MPGVPGRSGAFQGVPGVSWGSGEVMKKFIKLLIARRLAATPIGLIVLGLGLLLGRRRRQRRDQHPGERSGRHYRPVGHNRPTRRNRPARPSRV